MSHSQWFNMQVKYLTTYAVIWCIYILKYLSFILNQFLNFPFIIIINFIIRTLCWFIIKEDGLYYLWISCRIIKGRENWKYLVKKKKKKGATGLVRLRTTNLEHVTELPEGSSSFIYKKRWWKENPRSSHCRSAHYEPK